MYFKCIEIENVGPIDNIKINFPRKDNGAPKPLIVVGENGAGKTILLSHLVNALLTGKQAAYDDGEVEEGKASVARMKYGSNLRSIYHHSRNPYRLHAIVFRKF